MTARPSGICACVFDAYGTLFDFNSAARGAQDALGPAWQQLSEVWRTKQVQYTWLRSKRSSSASSWTCCRSAWSGSRPRPRACS